MAPHHNAHSDRNARIDVFEADDRLKLLAVNIKAAFIKSHTTRFAASEAPLQSLMK